MPRNRDKPTRADSDFWATDSWPYAPPPVPDAVEGGESVWDAWHEAARQLDEAFAPTQPSVAVPLTPDTPAEPRPSPGTPLTADALMVIARRNNRVCPHPILWKRLYEELEGDRHEEVQPPPIQPWIWSKLSSLQKRLRFREHVEWAERKGKLRIVAEFIGSLAEADWVHMGE